MKKALALLFASMMLVSMVACRGGDAADTGTTDDTAAADVDNTADEPAAEEDGDEPAAADENWKIGIITGTVSQGEEEFQAAQMMIERHGADHIITATYPDNFSTETETVIAQVVSLASDPDVKAIVFVQAVGGASAAIDKVRETKPDMLFVCGVAAEDPPTIASKADVVMLVDELGMGTAVPTQAKKQGAETFIHYSFPRHLSYATISARRAIMIETCAEIGIDFVDETAPDPTGDSGAAGAQQFILEDVPRKVEQYGVDTAFFSTNCSMQEPLIRSILELGAVFPQQCCPSPYHGYPAALNIEVEGHEGDVQYMLDQISEKVSEGGNSGRMSTWALPVNMLMVEAGVDYAIKFINGEVTDRFDDAAFRACIDKVAVDYGVDAQVTIFAQDVEDEETGESEFYELENFYMILCDYYDF